MPWGGFRRTPARILPWCRERLWDGTTASTPASSFLPSLGGDFECRGWMQVYRSCLLQVLPFLVAFPNSSQPVFLLQPGTKTCREQDQTQGEETVVFTPASKTNYAARYASHLFPSPGAGRRWGNSTFPPAQPSHPTAPRAASSPRTELAHLHPPSGN